MRVNLLGKNIELSPEIEKYVSKKVTNLSKLLSKIEKAGGQVTVQFEVSKSTQHHKRGIVFHADCLVNVGRKKFYSGVDAEDLYAAIDAVKENLFREISKYKDRRQTLSVRGARSVKKMMKGLSKRNPLTGKY
jgi:putative sigma-54 modulation protein